MAYADLSIRSAFRVAIVIMATLAFLAVANISFYSISTGQFDRAQNSIRSEVEYLCLQLEKIDNRSAALTASAESGQDTAALDSASDPITDLLSGYTLAETGTVVISVGDTIVASDDPKLPPGSSVRDLLGNDIADAIEQSCTTDELLQIVNTGASAGAQEPTSTEAYLLARHQGDRTVFIIESADRIYRDRATIVGRVLIVAIVMLAVVLTIVDRLLVLVVARRIDKTNDALARITAGDLEVRVEDKGTREFKSLSAGINHTVDSLKNLIAEAETRMDAELATAHTIQESALPRVFPPFPDISRLDVYASMQPARQVGGDFYDFFLIGDSTPDAGKLAFVVSDVSGKGIPAALFMMKAKAQIRDYLQSGLKLGEAMAEANRQLCDGNDAGMFVTSWVGVLDYATGHIDYVNAGHNPPLLWQRDGGWRWLSDRSGLPLGLFEGLPYKVLSVDCKPGDTLLLYTDGVTEAFDTEENQYGEERLLSLVEHGSHAHPQKLVELVRGDVAEYAKGAEQSDDITVLALEYGIPPEVTTTLEVPAHVEELGRVNDFLHAELDRRLCPKRVQNQIDIAVEELFVNVCHYAYPNATADEPGTVRIQRTYFAEPPSITVDIIDEGVPFDPLAKPDATLPSNIEDMQIGGLGIFMTKQVVDELRYERVDNTNVVTIVKRW